MEMKREQVKLMNHLRTYCEGLNLYETDEHSAVQKEEQMKLEHEAKEGLIAFYEMFSSLDIETKEYNRSRFHTSYLLQLIPIKKAFKKEQYRLVCHELETLLNYEPFFQPRVFYNILDVLKEHLDLRDKSC